MQVSEEQIELLARALEDAGDDSRKELPYEMDPDESSDFYRGVINGMVLSHQILLESSGDLKRVARLLSLGAALASEQYLKMKDSDTVLFAEDISENEN